MWTVELAASCTHCARCLYCRAPMPHVTGCASQATSTLARRRPLEDIVPVLAHSMCMDTLSLYHKKFLYTKAELKKLVEEQACFETLVQDARLD